MQNKFCFKKVITESTFLVVVIWSKPQHTNKCIATFFRFSNLILLAVLTPKESPATKLAGSHSFSMDAGDKGPNTPQQQQAMSCERQEWQFEDEQSSNLCKLASMTLKQQLSFPSLHARFPPWLWIPVLTFLTYWKTDGLPAEQLYQKWTGCLQLCSNDLTTRSLMTSWQQSGCEQPETTATAAARDSFGVSSQ